MSSRFQRPEATLKCAGLLSVVLPPRQALSGPSTAANSNLGGSMALKARPGGCRHTEPAEEVVASMSVLQSSQCGFKYPRPGDS